MEVWQKITKFCEAIILQLKNKYILKNLKKNTQKQINLKKKRMLKKKEPEPH